MEHPSAVKAYFERIGAEVLNFRRAIVRIYKGHYYTERALIKISDDGEVTCSLKEYAPTDEEFASMKEALRKFDYPRSVIAKTAKGCPAVDEHWVYLDRSRSGVIMVQEKKYNQAGQKYYVPWTMMSNGEWMSMEPDGPLPFWKPKKKQGPGAKIMVHEGAKVAAFVNKLIDEKKKHPWLDELMEYEHWGMQGGALAPHRTDYDELKMEQPSKVIYACDNDQPGIAALQKVSRQWGRSLSGIVYGKDFPEAWDLADEMPKKLFNGARYNGPRLTDLITPATWATEMLPNPTGKGRGVAIIRPEFAEEWMHSVSPEVFIHKDWAHKIITAGEFNSQVAPFSHVDDTSRLLKKEFGSKAAVLRYLPAKPSGIYSSEGGLYINTYRESTIKAEDGDASQWLDFISGLVPEPADRKELLRWCATLIARPDTRMLYGVLLISETQGIGKGTLGEKVLAQIVGFDNVSYPSEQEIVESSYNYWLAHKRLAVVHEIYAGQSSKAYNKLKSCITDKYITVSKKYQANYEIENWIHIFACSNSMRAMKLSVDDRRWFVPKVTETKQSPAYWSKFNHWLAYEGGLGIIKGWAAKWLQDNDPVIQGEAAPWSNIKKQIIEEGYSTGQSVVAKALEVLQLKIEAGELPRNSFFLDCHLVELIKFKVYDGRQSDKLERPATVRAVAKAMGWSIGENRAQIRSWGPHTMGGRIISLDPETANAMPSDLGGEKLPPKDRREPIDLLALGDL